MKYLTLQPIKAHKPCPDQFRRARRLFGKRKRIAVTVALAVKVAPLFDWDRIAEELLTAATYKAYDEAKVAACKAYNAATAAASKVCGEALAAAYKAYDEARAAAFARAYLSM